MNMTTQSIQPEQVNRNEYGWWIHSQYPEWCEGTTEAVVKAWEKENGVRIKVISMEHDGPEELVERYFETCDGNFSEWNPAPPAADAFLLAISDTEEGPYALFAVPQMKGETS